MAEKTSWWAAHRPSKRRLIQLYSALLYNAHIKGFIDGEIYTGKLKQLCLPGLNCYSCPGAVGACPLGALQNSLASADKRVPFYILGILMLTGLIFGRTVCGFLCPMGLLQELLDRIPVPKLRKGRLTRVLSHLKYIILGLFVVIIPLKYALSALPVPAFCKYICPAGTFEGAMGLLANPGNGDLFPMLGVIFTRKFVILILILLGCVFVHRFFCRFLCPLGAIYGCFNRLALLGVKTDYSKCTACGLCAAKCGMDIRRVGDRECVQCGKCIDVCPVKAISWKNGRIMLKPNEGEPCEAPVKKRASRGAAACVAALALLVFVLWYVNKPSVPDAADAVVPAAEMQDDTPVGNDPGNRCPDFTVPLYGSEGGSFTLSEHRGKVTVINFWATWCTPCCAELPWFAQLDENYPEVDVIAIHSKLVTADVQAYIDRQSYSLPFALDADGSVIASLGGSTMLPMTVILDKNGHIVYNAVGSVTYEKLEGLIAPLLNGGTL